MAYRKVSGPDVGAHWNEFEMKARVIFVVPGCHSASKSIISTPSSNFRIESNLWTYIRQDTTVCKKSKKPAYLLSDTADS